MDHIDKIILLKAILNKKLAAEDEFVKQLDISSMIIKSTDTGTELADNDREFIDSAISKAEEVAGTTAFNLLNSSLGTGKIPRELYNEDLPGAIPYDLIKEVPVFQVRGKSYLRDGKKVDSGSPLFFLRGMQVVRRPTLSRHVAMEDWCGYPKHSHENEWLILNYMIPGSTCVHVVALYTASPEAMDVIRAFSSGAEVPIGGSSAKRAWARLLQRFWAADDDFCNERFKLIPNIAEGSWTIKLAVGQKPALTGKKLTQTYYRGPGYFEVDIDVSSSSIATGILAMVRGVSKSMVVDLGIAIQGESEEDLPEAILCQTRFSRVDLESAVPV